MILDRNQGLALFILSGLFFYIKMPLIGFGFLVLGLLRYKKFMSNPQRVIIEKIKSDAGKENVIIPQNSSIQERIVNVYAKLEKVKKLFPMMGEEIDEIKRNFWIHLSLDFSEDSWDRSLYKLESLKLFPSSDNLKLLDGSLNKLKNSFEFFREAQVESGINQK